MPRPPSGSNPPDPSLQALPLTGIEPMRRLHLRERQRAGVPCGARDDRWRLAETARGAVGEAPPPQAEGAREDAKRPIGGARPEDRAAGCRSVRGDAAPTQRLQSPRPIPTGHPAYRNRTDEEAPPPRAPASGSPVRGTGRSVETCGDSPGGCRGGSASASRRRAGGREASDRWSKAGRPRSGLPIGSGRCRAHPAAPLPRPLPSARPASRNPGDGSARRVPYPWISKRRSKFTTRVSFRTVSEGRRITRSTSAPPARSRMSSLSPRALESR